MAVPVECGTCRRRFNAGGGLAGKRVTCPKCGGPIDVPAAIKTTQEIPAGPDGSKGTGGNDASPLRSKVSKPPWAAPAPAPKASRTQPAEEIVILEVVPQSPFREAAVPLEVVHNRLSEKPPSR